MLPLDIIRHIYSFGDPTHRIQLKKVHAEMGKVLLSKIPERYPYIRQDHERYYGATTRIMLQEFFHYRRCYCCSRHAHNKPTLHLTTHLLLRTQREWIPECADHFDCRCPCRHNMRVIVEWMRARTHLPL